MTSASPMLGKKERDELCEKQFWVGGEHAALDELPFIPELLASHDAADARIAELSGQLHATNALATERLDDISSLHARITELEAMLAEAKLALEPFATVPGVGHT